jgi:hypothetical protein
MTALNAPGNISRQHADRSAPRNPAPGARCNLSGPSFARSGAGGRRGAWRAQGPALGRVSGRFGPFRPRAAYYKPTAAGVAADSKWATVR